MKRVIDCLIDWSKIADFFLQNIFYMTSSLSRISFRLID